ncbi:ribonucleotide-diphosphate reductase subunit alpha [Pseudoalteromonas phage PH357]|nr:ribonucleotide-diphosphate reductase subunit alpha [Pseudoalteromonas phage PH357]
MEVVVYGKPNCPYCVKAKGILDNKKVDYTYIDISEDDSAKEFLKEQNLKTVPQIFVNGNYHGESDSANSVGEVADDMMVTKRDGTKEPIDLEKIHKVIKWAAEGLNDVSVSQVELSSHIQFYNGISSDTIHQTVIKSAADLISADEPDYQYLAARLCVYRLRKMAYGEFTPPHIYNHVKNVVSIGKYDKHLLEDYTEEDFNKMESFIDHSRDMNFAYAGIQQLQGKYLVQNRVTGEIYETPQMLYMLVGACLFSSYPENKRMKYIKKFYDAVSKFKLSLPTPIMAGVRTPTRQFSSCVLIECGDSLDSINATAAAIVKYISMKAGIGINAGAIRAEGSEIRGGEAKHTGCIPFYKHFQTAVKSCSQGGVRGGAATLFYPLWHLEVENLLVLKNNKGVDDNRVRHLDYGVQFNRLMYERLVRDEYITLFSPSDVEGLYDSFFDDQEKFKELYEAAEVNPRIRKKQIKAVELFSMFAQERASTGRIYLQNVDHCNNNSPFDARVAPIKQSNLCVAPETQILTDKGYVPIAELEDETVNVWNGEEFSETVVKKTGENQKLLRVVTSSGQELECTPYHKWYVFNGYGKPYVEKRTHELKDGDKLAKFDLPVIEGHKELSLAWQNGFYTADGHCDKRNGAARVYLYHEKRKLRDNFDFVNLYVREEENREYGVVRGLKDKYFVPNEDYTIASRLSWLAGWLDGDGCVYRNGTKQQIVGSSIEKEFLLETQRMLQTLGVSAKFSDLYDEGYRKLPKNDGSGELGGYWCQKSWRLLITSCDVYKLMVLGLGDHLKRLEVVKRLPQRDAKQFNKVVEVIDEGRYDDTYCFNEPKRHMGMFNGILTGQCLEIALPTKPMMPTDDENSEIALCTLSAFNLGEIRNLNELEGLADIAVRALDNLLSYQSYPLNCAKIGSYKRRTLGIGVINYAFWLARQGLNYSGKDGNTATHELFEAIQYYCLKASNSLAKEFGACSGFDETTYSKGILPIDRYKKEVDTVHSAELLLDWESLRKDIVEFGLRNSTLTALMPAETSAQVSNSTNGIEPPRGLVSVKASKDGILKQVVPCIKTYRNNYELLWDIPDNKGYIEKVGIMQKFVDQAISANTNYDPSKFPDGKVSMQVILEDILYAYKLGWKTAYYHNTRDGANDSQGDEVVEVEDESCSGGACKI